MLLTHSSDHHPRFLMAVQISRPPSHFLYLFPGFSGAWQLLVSVRGVVAKIAPSQYVCLSSSTPVGFWQGRFTQLVDSQFGACNRKAVNAENQLLPSLGLTLLFAVSPGSMAASLVVAPFARSTN